MAVYVAIVPNVIIPIAPSELGYLSNKKGERTILAQVEKLFAQKQSLVVATAIKAESAPDLIGQKLYATAEVAIGELVSQPFYEQLLAKCREALQQGEVAVIELAGGSFLLEPLHPAAELLVLGGGHIAQPLVEIAATLQYQVTVVDDRPSFANNQRFPRAKRVLCEDFTSVFSKLELGPHTSVVIVTRGHSHDLQCLEQVMPYACNYVGMIGSRRRVKLIREHLLNSGIEEARISRIHMPIGLDLGAQTPEEIAVSIAAELIAHRRKAKVPTMAATLFGAQAEYYTPPAAFSKERELLQQALELVAQGEPVVLATIVQTKGSTPRKAGSKMIILRDGRTWGTIGGGCGEAAVRRQALQLFDHGGCEMYRVMLDAATAAEEGMVCGGLMDVFIERLV